MEFPVYKKVRVEDLIPYARNSRTHSDEQVAQIAASIREFGFLSPIIVDGEQGIIAGHGRVLAARKLGLDYLPAVEAAHLTDAQRRAYVIADNQHALNAGWNKDLLKIELTDLLDEGFSLDALGFDADQVADLMDMGELSLSENYSRKIKIPTYEPKGECPPVKALLDDSKTSELIADIEAAITEDRLPDDVAGFLRLAAERHTVFDFAKIADFYAHSDAKVQRLFEASGLVIIDFDQAIEAGFVELTDRLSELASFVPGETESADDAG